jgi:hypothetical protein
MPARLPPFAGHRIFNSPAAHAYVWVGVAYALHTSFKVVTHPCILLLAAVASYFWVDALSAVLHCASDNVEVNSAKTTIIGGHHNDPLNYMELTSREKLAVSYFGTIPLLTLQLIVGPTYPFLYVVNTFSAILAATVAFVHDASHRRRCCLPLPRWVEFLQDHRIIMNAQDHVCHHKDPNCDYGFLHGKTDWFTNKFLTRLSVQPALTCEDRKEAIRNINLRLDQFIALKPHKTPSRL